MIDSDLKFKISLGAEKTQKFWQKGLLLQILVLVILPFWDFEELVILPFAKIFDHLSSSNSLISECNKADFLKSVNQFITDYSYLFVALCWDFFIHDKPKCPWQNPLKSKSSLVKSSDLHFRQISPWFRYSKYIDFGYFELERGTPDQIVSNCI